jgi:predicted unusual protein kinase regulating ubiquinone biosynthesis (AarF/ABC1/UbiB family)
MAAMPGWLGATLFVLGVALGVIALRRVSAGAPAARDLRAIPTSVLGRGRAVSGLVVRSLWRRLELALRSLRASSAQRQALRDRYHMQVAEEAAATMGNMKGAFMKLGQIMSFAVEQLPENARNTLARLQMDAPPMAFSIAREVIERDLGQPLTKLFRSIDEEPLAAASIGQVHAARLHDGTEVVVKVQYPGVAAAIESDLRASDGLAAMVSAINANIDAHGVVEEVKARLFEELDYRRELEHQALFHTIWEGHPLVRVPRPLRELSGAHTLTQERIHGLPFAEFVAHATHDEKRLAVHVLNDFVFDSMNRHCIFNGDPHPGNYLFTPSGAIAFLDYGCVKHFSREFILDLQALNRALMSDDRAAFEALLHKLRVVLPGRPYALDELWSFFCYHAAGFRQDQVFTFTPEWVREAFAVMDPTKQTQINLPPDFVFLNRITFGLNSILLKLGASENFHRMHRRWNYPDERLPPALAGLGVQLPERFCATGFAEAPSAPLSE